MFKYMFMLLMVVGLQANANESTDVCFIKEIT